MKTDCNTSAGSARPELTVTDAAEQIGQALQQAMRMEDRTKADPCACWLARAGRDEGDPDDAAH